MAELDLIGYTQMEIADKVRVSQTTVGTFLKELRQRYKDAGVYDHAAMVYEKRQQYRYVRKLAIEAHIRCLEGNLEVVETHELRAVVEGDEADAGEGPKPKRGRGGQRQRLAARMKKVREVIARKGMAGASGWLSIVMDTLRAECQLLGLNAPDKVDVNQTTRVIDWAALMSAGAGPETIEGELAKVEALAVENGLGKDAGSGSDLKELPPANGEGSNGEAR